MSATQTLRNDHKQIRRLEKVIEKCYTKLYDGKDIPFSDIEQITLVMSDFIDAIHYSREEDACSKRFVGLGCVRLSIQSN